jgi:hypothetical protein
MVRIWEACFKTLLQTEMKFEANRNACQENRLLLWNLELAIRSMPTGGGGGEADLVKVYILYKGLKY